MIKLPCVKLGRAFAGRQPVEPPPPPGCPDTFQLVVSPGPYGPDVEATITKFVIGDETTWQRTSAEAPELIECRIAGGQWRITLDYAFGNTFFWYQPIGACPPTGSWGTSPDAPGSTLTLS